MTTTIEAQEAAPAASIFEQPVVNIFAARLELRPDERPEIYRPSLNIGNIALGALFEALFETKPRLAERTLMNVAAAARIAREQDPKSDEAILTRSTLEWLRDLRAMVQLREGEA